ncbi:hypothetical protein EBR78_06745 [bacterium]|nr:hypothetical protein [bacterium]
MSPRLVLIFVLLALIGLALKKGLTSQAHIPQRVPGYPEPVALKKFVPSSDEEFLANLPSAREYGLQAAANSEERSTEVMGPFPKVLSKKIVNRKVSSKKSSKTNRSRL